MDTFPVGGSTPVAQPIVGPLECGCGEPHLAPFCRVTATFYITTEEEAADLTEHNQHADAEPEEREAILRDLTDHPQALAFYHN